MITDFKNYVDNTKFINHKISVFPQQIIINTIPNNINLIIDYTFIATAIVLLLKIEAASLYIPAIMLLFAFIKLWKDFEPINYITINLNDKQLSIRSKNLLKLLFIKSRILTFSDIKSVNHIEISKLKSFTRYRLILSSKNEDEIILTDFNNDTQAATFALKIKTLFK